MAVRPTAVFFFLLLLLLAAFLPGGSPSAGDFPLGLLPFSLAGCHGTIAECLGSGVELDLDTEMSRRMLGTTAGSIGYGALNPGTTPCSQRGDSYYSNCQPGGSVNSYNRDCSNIDLCRKG